MAIGIALVGHCGPDGYMLRSAVKYVVNGAEIRMINDSEGLEAAIKDGVTTFLINRVLDWGFADRAGVALIKHLREKHPELKLLLISDYPDAQQAALKVGALPGFGKSEVGTTKMREALAAVA